MHAGRGWRPSPWFLVNAEDWDERQQFTIAHELGHSRSTSPWSRCGTGRAPLRRRVDIIGAATYRTLFKEFDRLGWRSPPYEESGAMAGELPSRFAQLCARALAEGAISESKAAELLDIGIGDVDDCNAGRPAIAAGRGGRVSRRRGLCHGGIPWLLDPMLPACSAAGIGV